MSGSRKLTDGRVAMSYSRLSTFELCPRKYELKYLLDVPDETGDAAEIGRRIHSYLENRARGIDAELPHIALAVSNTYEALQQLTDDMDLTLHSPDLVGIEEVLRWEEMVEGAGVAWESRIDALRITNDNVAVVKDYKSGWKLPREVTDDVQGKLYGLAVRKHYPQVWLVRFEQVQLRYNKILKAEYSADDLNAFEEALYETLVRLVRSTRYAPRPGDHCKLCPYALTHCEAGKQLLGGSIVLAEGGPAFAILPIQTQDDADRYAQGLAWLKEGVAKRVSEVLDKWTEEHGPAWITEDSAYGHWVRNNNKVTDLQAVIRVLEEHGIDPTTVLRPSMDDLKPLLRGKKKIAGLADYVVKDPSSYFGLRKNVNRESYMEEWDNGSQPTS